MWNDTPARAAIVDFVEQVTTEGGPGYVPPAERVATFDDADLRVLMAGMLQAFAGISVEHYTSAADAFLRGGKHPTLGRAFHACGYAPMIELLGYLEANGFTNYIASGGDRDFMRPITEDVYSIPPERVIGSSNALRYLEDEHGGTITYAAEPAAATARPPRRRRPRVRLHRRSREITREGRRPGMDGRQHQARLEDRLRRPRGIARQEILGGVVGSGRWRSW
jgi:hypothetical protein